ncbi:hypothetical protein DFQ29_000036 [Apophysomyces sp. BC1021]|nr:hypothetical protein DFQ29_000035 [Apophysomyces sp. BC1021]KAG0183611.1 hypothetical protein DFQ29_000036 [Apophysomyces sp. BC1021]
MNNYYNLLSHYRNSLYEDYFCNRLDSTMTTGESTKSSRNVRMPPSDFDRMYWSIEKALADVIPQTKEEEAWKRQLQRQAEQEITVEMLIRQSGRHMVHMNGFGQRQAQPKKIFKSRW